jgi:N-acetylglucosamine kinase-like BadF-type ATPase
VICLDWPSETPIFENRLRDCLKIEDVTALNDSLIALRAGSSAPDKCVICAGTGLNIAAQTASGQTFVWGCYITMNLMGGLTLGRMAIEAAVEAEAGIRPPTALSGLLLRHTGYRSFEAMYTDLTTGKYDFPQQHLVPGLLEIAESGDTAALEILDYFTEKVTRYTNVLINRMGLAERETELVYTGGIFKNRGRMVSGAIKKKLAPTFPRLRFIDAKLEPICGAMLTMLDRRYDNRIPGDVLDRFTIECERLGLQR